MMISLLKLTIFAILSFVVHLIESKTFDNQFLGNYLTDEEYFGTEKCSTKVCLADADRLIYAATRNVSIKPCDDFKTFAMGEFFMYRKKNDRYSTIGFKEENDRLFAERQRVVLKAPIVANELKIFKVIKSFFKKCSDTDYVRNRGGNDIVAYLQKLGGSPLTMLEAWDEDKFDVVKLFEEEPRRAMLYLADHELSRCNDPNNDKKEVLCLKRQKLIRPATVDLTTVLKRLHLDKKANQIAINNYVEFLMIQNFTSVGSMIEEVPKVLKIKDFSSVFPQFKINWLKLYNDQLLKNSQVTTDEEVLIENPVTLDRHLSSAASINKSVISNAFVVQYLFAFHEVFITHFLPDSVAKLLGTKQSIQRFESCIHSLSSYSFDLALDALMAKKYFDESTRNALNDFALDVVKDYRNEVEAYEIDDKHEHVKHELIRKLENVLIIPMFFDEVLNDTIIEEIYENFEGDESMTFLEMQIAVNSLNQRLNSEKKSSWISTMRQRNSEMVKYFFDDNILFIPLQFSITPFFVANRPRFFNVATLYTSIIGALNEGTRDYLRKEIGNNFSFRIWNVEIADKKYVEWERNGGKDLNLSAFKLTSRQMLWLCFAHVFTSQTQDKKIASPISTLQSNNIHVIYKNRKGFREAYQCGEMTQQELDLFGNYVKQVNELYTRS